MAGAITSLGLGSDGAISSDIIDQLRAVEEQSIINPIDNQISENSAKQDALSGLVTVMNGLKGFTSSLSDDSVYLERDAIVNGSSVAISVDSGVNPQSMELTVHQLAKGDVIQSDAFSAKEDAITNTSTTFELTVGDSDYSIDLDAGASLSDLMQKINDKEIGVKASILNTGPQEYRLILKSETLGEDGHIEIKENTDLLTNLTDEANRVQTAQNAEFSYNGVSITRSTNSVDDLVFGVKIELLTESEDPSFVEIIQNTDTIMEEVQSFVSTYNDLLSNLSTVTDYDEESNEAGVFQGESNIRNIKTDLNRALMQIEADGESLTTYGIKFNDAGLLEFNSSTLSQALEEDPDKVKEFFQGVDTTDRYGKSTHVGGVFYSINDIIDDYVGSNGRLTSFDTSLSNSYDNLVKEREKSMNKIDVRYEMMAERFAAYDAMIGSLTNSFESLNMMIQSEMNAD
jgi:flagellar hook-associated protein 2